MDPIQSQATSISGMRNVPVKNNRVRNFFAALIILIIAVALGVFGYMYVVKSGIFAIAPYNNTNLLTGIVEHMIRIDTSAYATTINVDSMPLEPDAKAFKLNNTNSNNYSTTTDVLSTVISSGTELAKMIPGDFHLAFKVSGNTAKPDANSTDTAIKLAVDGNFGDMSISVDAEVRKKLDNYFIMINKAPSLFFDISQIKKKWIKITPDDLGGGNMMGLLPTSDTDASSTLKAKQEIEKQQFIKILAVADETQLFVINGEPVSEKVGETRAYRYDLKLNKNNLVAFYKKITSELEKYGDDKLITFDQSVLDSLDSSTTADVVEYLNKNSTISIWADSNGMLVKTYFKIRLVSNEEVTSKTHEIVISTDTILSDINKPVTIDEPTGALSFEEVNLLLRGITKEQYYAEKQTANVESIRNALYNYYNITGTYPASLGDLKKKPSDLATSTDSNSSTSVDNQTTSYYKDKINNTPLLKTVPVDPYTKSSYVYTSSGLDYNLNYVVNMEPYKEGSSYYTFAKWYMGKTLGKNPNVSVLGLIFVNGSNTANKLNLSEEAFAQGLIDSDKDRLSDSLEQYIGTNPNKADTDGDGIKDGDEFTSGSNPNGPGKLKRNLGF